VIKQFTEHSASTLPVWALAGDIADALTRGNVLLTAEPGAGKSTALPLALLRSVSLREKIVLLEPRRLAARSVAERLAFHLGESVGQTIGLRMRTDTRVSRRTRLEVVTEGVLTRLLQNDPTLDGVSLVIFDEFHERSLHADLGLALCLEVQQALRDDLRLLLMSATLETDDLSKHLGDIKQFHCDVRQHAVETVWLGESKTPLPQRVAHAVRDALLKHTTDVLVFLPGVAEINRTAALLAPTLTPNVSLHQLHSGINQSAQKAAIAPASASSRRIILATSLAETSVTIDGVGVVIDSGLERRTRLDSSTGAQRLETVMASQASATQRAGRAGRTAAGTCYRLWGESGHTRRSSHWQPEIRRADLAPLLMELGLWGASSGASLPWLERPPVASLSRAETLLTRLGLWSGGQLTERGRAVAAIPVHPRLGHMLLWAAEHGVCALACHLAVRLEEQHRSHSSVDLDSELQVALPSSLRKRADRLQRLLNGQTKFNPNGLVNRAHTPSAAVVLAQAYPDWLAQRRAGDAGRFQLACGAGAVLSADYALSHSAWLVVAELGGSGTQARIFKALELNIKELQEISPEYFKNVAFLEWDDKQERVLAENRIMVDQLVVAAKPIHNISHEDRAKALLVGIRRRGLSCLPWNNACHEWRARVHRMSTLSLPSRAGKWPKLDDDELLNGLDTWLLPWLTNVGSMKALQQIDLYKVLSGLLDYSQQALMDEWLPSRYQVPSGSMISLSYTEPGNPVLSVRLQEMLGYAQNPTIANGQIPLKVELLSPARRPVQVTEDLANFWTNSYPAVKKEMAGRYPKHVWPDDPLEAQATSCAKRRK